MSDTRTGFRIPDAMWKYAAVGFATLCLGIIEGQFVPNRNIVTQDQLATTNSKIDAIAAAQTAIAAQVNTMIGEFAEWQKRQDEILMSRKP